MPATDIFDSKHHWRTDPALAYSSWLANSRHLKASTKVVYRAMFHRFCEWLQQEGIAFEHVEPHHIDAFLASPNPNLPESRQGKLTGRQRQQYVRLLDRAFAHLEHLGIASRNPGRKAAHEKIGHGKDRPTRFLSKAECEAVIRLLTERLGDLLSCRQFEEVWVEYRDLAMVASMLGAGVKLGDLRGLTLNCMNLTNGYLDLSTGHNAHRARLLPFAVAPIQTWLSVRKTLYAGVADPYQKVFEADHTSGRGKTSKVVTLSASSIHRRTHRLLAMAGVGGDRASAQTLRNTYAGLLIEAGASDNELMDNLGLKAAFTAERLRTSYRRSAMQKK